jgi:hypothetical protein
MKSPVAEGVNVSLAGLEPVFVLCPMNRCPPFSRSGDAIALRYRLELIVFPLLEVVFPRVLLTYLRH